jgi:ParB family chromosome partitioning protein
MTQQRVLIVEPDHPFGLSLASLFQEDGFATRVAAGAAEAEREIALRRPDLIVLRAELPDLSGFSLCARLRHDRATARLPLILYSSDTAPASLAEHARTPWAANGYLAMPLDTTALRTLARRFLAAAAVVESADDAVIEEAEPLTAPEAPPPTPAPSSGNAPPPMPKREQRDALTDEDRRLVDRIFQSIADRRDALLAEAGRQRPPQRRELLQSADGRLQLLRDDIKAREAQIAQLAEVWEIREREVSYAGEWLHEKDVELQGFKGEVEDLRRRLSEAREAAVAREREHGASVDGMMLERVKQEKELIEAVAGNERRLHVLKREYSTLEAELAAERSQSAAREGELAAERARAATLAGEVAAERERAATVEGELAAERAKGTALAADVAERDRLLSVAQRENERLQGELTAARHDLMVSVSEGHAAAEKEKARAEELAKLLAVAQRERDEAVATSPVAGPPPEAGEP